MTVASARTGDFDLPNHLAIEEGPGVNGLWVEPVPGLILGDVQDWASFAQVAPSSIPAYWILKRNSTLSPDAPPQPDEKVILSFHGGGYTGMSGHPRSPTSGIARSLLEAIPTVHRVFSLEYRLARTDPLPRANPFPAQLIDAIAAYDHLINVAGFDPADIILEGDSAGGNLVLQLTLYLIEHRTQLLAHAERTGTRALTAPGGLLLISPWVDIGVSYHSPVPSYWARTDFIAISKHPDFLYDERAVCGRHGWPSRFADTNRHLSPVSRADGAERVSFIGWPRTFLNGGGAERLIESIRALKEHMSADMGEGTARGEVYYYEAEDGIHDYVAMPFFEPERSETLAKIAEWASLM